MDFIFTSMGEELFPLVYHQPDSSPFSPVCGYLSLTEDEVLQHNGLSVAAHCSIFPGTAMKTNLLNSCRTKSIFWQLIALTEQTGKACG